jgi:hypothetical protein
MNIVTCPNCKMRVIPRSDGSCPSCQFELSQPEVGVDFVAPAPRTNQGVQDVDAQVWKFMLMILTPTLVGLILMAMLYSLLLKRKRK